jgi:branched-chain amino acid transport system ATP-binding protein
VALLELEGVDARYGPVHALHGVSLEVPEGEMVAVLGANGAGKTTTLRAISNTVRKTGEVRFDGRSISRRSPEAVARLGIAHVPEGRGMIGEFTVRENLKLGAYVRRDRDTDADRRRVLELFPRLAERERQPAGTLSGGEQQMLAVGRALMGSPKLLLLDEPSMGLAPVLVDLIFDTIQTIRDQGTTVLVVEQNALAALRIADYGYLLESGRLKLEGPGSELAQDADIVRAYMGG